MRKVPSQLGSVEVVSISSMRILWKCGKVFHVFAKRAASESPMSRDVQGQSIPKLSQNLEMWLSGWFGSLKVSVHRPVSAGEHDGRDQ